MENLHVIPTPNPSRLFINPLWERQLRFVKDEFIEKNKERLPQNIYITNSEEIKEEEDIDKHTCIFVSDNGLITTLAGKDIGRVKTIGRYYKIILTTDQDLIKDGVQAIPNEFLEWFVKNPSCEDVEVIKTFEYYTIVGGKSDEIYYKIIIPKEEPKQETFNSKRGLKEVQLKDPNTCENYKEVGCVKDVCDCYTLVSKEETLEEVAENYAKSISSIKPFFRESTKKTFIDAVKYQQEQDKNKYSEEDLKEILTKLSLVNPSHLKMTIDGCGEFPDSYKLTEKGVNYIIEQFKKK